ncbi:MAG TPA: cyclic pyranopterin monophosphate synthase MoaC [Planctomycetota bacterium]|nr:cyclic pyranopterin monophosphate synthase MoaC [Planctomycetota bacterium]
MVEPTHLDAAGRARMVDLSKKPETERHARAGCRVRLGTAAAETLRTGRAAKGDVVAAARVAGISAAKRAADLIPLCHPLRIGAAAVDLAFEDEATLAVTAEVSGVDRSGFEMEALVAASVAALTVYDMLKAVDKGITITDLRLLEKSGGKSGRWTREGR